ncbi:PAS domain S-box protein [Chloroflexota bacterium]
MLAIVIVASISFPLLRYGDRQWRNSIEETIPIRDSVLIAKSYLSKGFLFLEKRVAGDETIRIDDVLYMFSQADQLIRDSLKGQSSITFLPSSTPTDPELISKLEQFHLEIERFHDISRERWEKRELPDVGTTIQQRSSFYLLEYMANDITLLMDQKTSKALDRQGLITSITLSVWIVILMFIGYLLFRGGRKRWLAEEEVRNYQTNLEGLVKERTNELTTTNEQLQQEITERQIAEQNFRNSLDNSPLGARIVTTEGELLHANQAILDIYGYNSVEELRTTSTEHHYTPESYTEHQKRTENRKLGVPIPDDYEISIVCKDGAIRHLQVFRKEITWNGEANFLVLYQDITDRKRAEHALTEEKERLEVTLRSTGDGVIATDIKGNVTVLNRVAEQLTGWTQEEAIGKPIEEVFHIVNENTRKRITNPISIVLETGRIVGLINHATLISRDGTERVIADSGAPIHDELGNLFGVILVFRDISETRKLEEELQKIDKLESVGTLAGGIAHDFNNLLTGIMGFTSMAKTNVEPGGKVFSLLAKVEEASLRARDLTQQLLTFARGGAPVKELTPIRGLLEDSTLFALRGSNVRPQFSLPDDLWPVEIDKGQINQVITNIVINADEAMPEGGDLHIGAKNIVVKRQSTLPLTRGDYVQITFKDNGVGVSKDILDKIFNPYFTTKQKGSGLGLATTYSIIRKHEGHITVESTPTTGTTFHVYLPAIQKPLPEEKETIEETRVTGTGKVLVMDDEEIVRELLYQGLTGYGYEVEVTEDGAEAIERYSEAKELGKSFDAVIMDLTIPGGMGGKEAIKKLLEIDPDAKVIVSSGYSADPIMANFEEHGFSAAIAKPYIIEQLGETLFKLLTKKK